MLKNFRNFIINIFAAFIRDKEARQRFRKKYKIKTNFKILRDTNDLILKDIEQLTHEVRKIKSDLNNIKTKYNQHISDWEADKSYTFRVKPLNNLPPHGPDSEVTLAIACVAKNEGQYLKEWIEYHKIVGVERFYFYDNESDDNTKDILEPYINDGTVVYHYLPNHPITNLCPQIEAYNDSIFKYRDKTRWMAIIDIDEFLVPVEKQSITDFLIDYEQYPGVVVNWMCFDSNGLDKKPNANGGLVTANYTRTRKDHNKVTGHNVGDDRWVKCIVDPKLIVHYISSHKGLYYKNRLAVDENFKRIAGARTSLHSSNKIRINHYLTKSREEYVNKISRNHKLDLSVYEFKENTLNFPEDTVDDYVIQRFIPKLKEVMGIKD